MKTDDIVSGTSLAAFARGPDGTITAWNEAAEAVFDLPAAKVVGKPCHAVLDGHDDLGAYCRERCPSWRAACGGRPIHPYQLRVRHGGDRRIAVTVMILVVTEDDGTTLIHLVEPVAEPRVVFSLREDGESDARDEELLRVPWKRELTFRELDIMHELTIGHDCLAIASRLDLSTSRVWEQIASCIRKLEARSNVVRESLMKVRSGAEA